MAGGPCVAGALIGGTSRRVNTMPVFDSCWDIRHVCREPYPPPPRQKSRCCFRDLLGPCTGLPLIPPPVRVTKGCYFRPILDFGVVLVRGRRGGCMHTNMNDENTFWGRLLLKGGKNHPGGGGGGVRGHKKSYTENPKNRPPISGPFDRFHFLLEDDFSDVGG